MQSKTFFGDIQSTCIFFFNFACRTFDVCYSSYIMIFTLYIFVFVAYVYIFLISHELVFCNIGVETKERKKSRKLLAFHDKIDFQ